MPRSRRFTSLAALGVAGTLMLAACSGGTKPRAVPDAQGRTDLDMWVFAELHATYYEQMAERLEREEPGPGDQAQGHGLPVRRHAQQAAARRELRVRDARCRRHRGQPVLQLRRGGRQVAAVRPDRGGEALQGRHRAGAARPVQPGRVPVRAPDPRRRLRRVLQHRGCSKRPSIDYTTIKTWDDFQEAGAAYNKATGKAFGVASTGVDMVEPLIVAQLGGKLLRGRRQRRGEQPRGRRGSRARTGRCRRRARSRRSRVAARTPRRRTAPSTTATTRPSSIPPGTRPGSSTTCPTWLVTSRSHLRPSSTARRSRRSVAVVPERPCPKTSPNKEIAEEWLAFAKLSPEANVAVWEVLGFDPVNMAVWEDKEVTHNKENKFNKYFQTNLFDVLNEVPGRASATSSPSPTRTCPRSTTCSPPPRSRRSSRTVCRPRTRWTRRRATWRTRSATRSQPPGHPGSSRCPGAILNRQVPRDPPAQEKQCKTAS